MPVLYQTFGQCGMKYIVSEKWEFFLYTLASRKCVIWAS